MVGDRVIARTNIDTKKGEEAIRVFNGVLGCVTSLDLKEKKFTVHFPDLCIDMMFSPGTVDIDHAYCVTTWKYQGSEIDHVIVFFDEPWGLSCELLYTSVTRGKLSATVYIREPSLAKALETRIGALRVTRLLERISEAAKKRPRADEDASVREAL